MKSNVEISWDCPEYAEYKKLWDMTDWPAIDKAKYQKFGYHIITQSQDPALTPHHIVSSSNTSPAQLVQ